MPAKKDYSMAVHRLSSAHSIVNRLWQNAPDIQRDLVPDFVAVQAWPWVPSGYQLIEQSLKLLLAVRRDIRLSQLEKPIRRSHDLSALFGEQQDDDREEVSRVYESFAELHDYIGARTATSFLEMIGKGYGGWRYLLSEGPQGIPPNHVGALLEIAYGIIHRLRVSDATKPLPTVQNRIRLELDSIIGRICNHQTQQGSDDFRRQWEDRYNCLWTGIRGDNQLRLAIALHLENTDSPVLGPRPPPNPYVQPLPQLRPDQMSIVKRLKHSADRKNFLAYFLRETVQGGERALRPAP